MTGLAFLARAGEINPILKVVIVSAYGDMINVRKAMNLGAFDFLVKPINLKDLELTIEKTLKQVQALRRFIQFAEENSLLKMFLNKGVVERLLPTLRTVGSARGEIVCATIVFIDVFGFNDAVAHLTPDQALQLLNAHFDVIVPETTSRQGVIDKFLGDAVMAVFSGHDHLLRAVEASLSIRHRLSLLAQGAEGDSPYGCGISIGLDTGEVVAGFIGSKLMSRLDHTVLGHAVGTAARLQAAARRNQILVTEAVHETLRERFECGAAGIFSLSGRGGPERVYEVVGGVPLREDVPAPCVAIATPEVEPAEAR
jgi:class 3 adenylate cyclase